MGRNVQSGCVSALLAYSWKAKGEFSELRQDEERGGMKHKKRAGVLVPALGVAF